MQNKRRKSGSAMDGFVPRNRDNASKRLTLDNVNRKPTAHTTDGFVPREPRSTQPLALKDDEWADENTLNIADTGALDLSTDGTEPLTKSKWWQFGKKRRIAKGKSEPSRRKKIIKRILLVVLLVFVLVGGFVGWKVLKNTTKVFNGNILGLLDTTKLKGENQGRVNILLAGTSEDDPGHDGAKLTDSIMIVSVDVVTKKAFMISVPRDLWVDYQTRGCSVGYQGKINAVYTCGEQTNFKADGYASGGMGLLSKVVEDNFGLTMHYYAKINYTAFRETVDTVNGIDINLQTNDPKGILDRIFDWECKYKCYKVKYPNGPLHLNGEQALDLARARGDGIGYPTYGTNNDFGRTERQRQMLVALKDKALSIGILSNPAKLSSLLDSAGNNVDTDIKTNELRRMYEIGKDINNQNIKSIGLADEDVSLVETFRAVDGSSAIRPVAGTTNYSQIKAYIKKLTSSDPVVHEGASVVVLNGSGVAGLAQGKADTLLAKGITVPAVANGTARDATVIVDLSKGAKSGTKSYLEKLYGVKSVTTTATAPEAKNYQSDFVIILGKNAAAVSN